MTDTPPKIRLRATLVVEYDANPHSYFASSLDEGPPPPEEFAAIDKELLENGGLDIWDFPEPPTITVEVIG